jgi:hypothetical protein
VPSSFATPRAVEAASRTDRPDAAGQNAQPGRCLHLHPTQSPSLKTTRTKLPDFSSKVCDFDTDFLEENVSDFGNE